MMVLKVESNKITHNKFGGSSDFIKKKDLDEEDTSRVDGASEEVNHPSHYQHIKLSHNGKDEQKFEVVDIIQGIVGSLDLGSEASGFLWQVLKYIMRAPFKEDEIKDLEKSEWYLNRLISLLKSKEHHATSYTIEDDGEYGIKIALNEEDMKQAIASLESLFNKEDDNNA